jgi:hypothetical protein
MKILSKNTSRLMALGKHVVRIISVVSATPSNAGDGWEDKTPQLKVVFEDSTGNRVTAWFNLMGFKTYDELSATEQKSGKFVAMGNRNQNYAVVKATKKRVPSPEKTEAALNIVSRLAHDSGVEEGEEITEGDLVDRTVGIVVAENDSNNVRVTGTFRPTEEAVAELEQAAK